MLKENLMMETSRKLLLYSTFFSLQKPEVKYEKLWKVKKMYHICERKMMVEKTMQIMVSGKEGWEMLHLSATL